MQMVEIVYLIPFNCIPLYKTNQYLLEKLVNKPKLYPKYHGQNIGNFLDQIVVKFVRKTARF